MTAVVLALVLAAPAHNSSEGKSIFTLEPDGRVAISIQVGELDVPELCNADLSVADRAREEQKLTACLEQGVPRWLRLSGDGRTCPVAFLRWARRERTVTVDATAVCAALPRQLIIDWGLFVASALDHVSVALIEQPWAKPRLVMLSRRSSRFVLDVARPWWVLALVVVVAAVLFGSAGWFWRRRRATARARARG